VRSAAELSIQARPSRSIRVKASQRDSESLIRRARRGGAVSYPAKSSAPPSKEVENIHRPRIALAKNCGIAEMQMVRKRNKNAWRNRVA